MSLQEALKLMRMELGLTQSDLAQKLNKTYLTVNRWENGKGFPTRKAANDILSMARTCGASEACITYLGEVLIPETARGASAAAYGFPQIDRDFLFQLADGSTNALYVIEADTYKLLYVNRKADELAVKYRTEYDPAFQRVKKLDRASTPCYRYFGGRNTPCPFCPLADVKASGYTDIELEIPESGRHVRIHAKTATNREKKVYIIYLTDITRADDERNALYEMTNDIPAGVGIYHVYNDDRIELAFMNAKWFQMIGEERQRVLSKDPMAHFCLMHPDDRDKLSSEIKAAIAESRSVSFDMRMKLQDGVYHPIHLEARLIRKDDEKSTFYCRFLGLD